MKKKTIILLRKDEKAIKSVNKIPYVQVKNDS